MASLNIHSNHGHIGRRHHPTRLGGVATLLGVLSLCGCSPPHPAHNQGETTRVRAVSTPSLEVREKAVVASEKAAKPPPHKPAHHIRSSPLPTMRASINSVKREPPRGQTNIDIPPRIADACGGCHPVPQPHRFTKTTWHSAVNYMYWLFEKFYPQPAGYLPKSDALAFYEAHARARPSRSQRYPSLAQIATRFKWRAFQQQRAPSLIADISLSRIGKQATLIVTDMLAGRIETGDLLPESVPRVVAAAEHPTKALHHDLDGDGHLDYLILELRTFGAKDIDRGRVRAVLKRNDGVQEVTLLDGVGRIADAAIGDVDGDGATDIVVADFGWQKTGGLRLLTRSNKPMATLEYTSKSLDHLAGHVSVALSDMDGDGDLDIVDGLAQHHERIDLWTNHGQGNFTRRTIFKADTPMWGLNGLKVTDIDGDGDTDIIHFNGDTLDAPKLADFQGVHLLENVGGTFRNRQLAQLPGAHAIDIADFDNDGRQDIIAVANLAPDILRTVTPPDQPVDPKQPLESILIIRQAATSQFSVHSVLRKSACFSAVKAVDLDGDGDQDVVLGPFGLGWSLLKNAGQSGGVPNRYRICDTDQLYWLENTNEHVGQLRMRVPNPTPAQLNQRKLAALKTIVRNDPDDIAFRISLSDVLMETGRHSEANSAVRQAVQRNPKEVIKLFSDACDKGKIDACNNLGVLYFDGDGVSKDRRKAAQLYEKACTGQDYNACTNLALMYGGGVGVPRDERRGLMLLNQACTGSHMGACARLGELYRSGVGGGAYVQQGNQLLGHACRGGVQSACVALQRGLQTPANGSVASPVERHRQCVGGQLSSCVQLSNLYANGQGVARNLALAVQYAKRACDGGHAESCGNVGGAYYGGTGINQDLKKAQIYLKKACDGGSDKACRFMMQIQR